MRQVPVDLGGEHAVASTSATAWSWTAAVTGANARGVNRGFRMLRYHACSAGSGTVLGTHGYVSGSMCGQTSGGHAAPQERRRYRSGSSRRAGTPPALLYATQPRKPARRHVRPDGRYRHSVRRPFHSVNISPMMSVAASALRRSRWPYRSTYAWRDCRPAPAHNAQPNQVKTSLRVTVCRLRLWIRSSSCG